MFWLDITSFVIIAIYLVVGLSRGFLRSSIRFGNTALALCIAFLLAPTLSLLFTQTLHLDSSLSQLFTNTISGSCYSSSGTRLDNDILHRFSELTLGPEYWLNYTGGVESAEFIAKLSYALADSILVLICFFCIFGLTRILITLICGFIRAINKKRAFGWIARSTGALVSVLESVCVICIIFCTISTILPAVPSFSDGFVATLPSNPVCNWLFGIIQDFNDAVLLPWLLRFYI